MRAVSLVFAVALCASCNVAQGSPLYSQLVVFGDSLSDNGNAAIALGGTLPGDYAPNAFTDGPATTPGTTGPVGLWIDQLAPKLGLPAPLPFLANPANTNLAVASAETGATQIQDLGFQIAAYSLVNSFVVPSSALYIFWGGSNDVLNGSRTGDLAADNIYNYILDLHAQGAQNFLWLNLPPLGDTPGGAGSAALNAQSDLFNVQWAGDLAKIQAMGINVLGLDVNSVFKQILVNPAAFGFVNVTDPAQGKAVDPNTYLFWDKEHPTTAADALLAQGAYDALIATPEPGFFSGVFVSLVMIVLVARRRTNQ